MVSIIAAMAQNRIIGNKGKIPWYLPEDFRYFKEITINHSVVMGRKTFESIGKPLKNRTNIIITRNSEFNPDGCQVYKSVEEVISEYENEDIMIIGGQEIYNQFMKYADIIYLTYIDHFFEGDTYFPNFDMKDWIKVSEKKGTKDDLNPYDYYFQVFKRK
jgi:dihydrofolate reductase